MERKTIMLHVMRIDGVETCWGTRNCCVLLDLRWRLSSERDGRGNGSIAEREICPLLNSNWVGAWDFPAVNQLQICGEGRNQSQSLTHIERAGSWVQREEEISRGEAWPVVSKAHVRFPHPPAPHLGSFPIPPSILVLSWRSWLPPGQEKQTYTALGWDCFQNTAYLLDCLWVREFLRETPKAVVVVWSWTRVTKKFWLFAVRCPGNSS